MRSSATRSPTRSAGLPRKCAAAPSPTSSTRTRCRTTSARRSRRLLPELQRRRENDERRERGRERDGGRRPPPRPAVDGADADEQQQHAPRHEAEVDAAEDGVASAVVVAPVRKRSWPYT